MEVYRIFVNLFVCIWIFFCNGISNTSTPGKTVCAGNQTSFVFELLHQSKVFMVIFSKEKNIIGSYMPRIGSDLNSEFKDRFSIITEQNQMLLIINNTQEWDQGSYLCQIIYNGEPDVNVEQQLIVKERQNSSLIKFEKKETNDFCTIVTCSANSSHVKLKSANNTTIEGKFIVLDSCNDSLTHGDYSCCLLDNCSQSECKYWTFEVAGENLVHYWIIPVIIGSLVLMIIKVIVVRYTYKMRRKITQKQTNLTDEDQQSILNQMNLPDEEQKSLLNNNTLEEQQTLHMESNLPQEKQQSLPNQTNISQEEQKSLPNQTNISQEEQKSLHNQMALSQEEQQSFPKMNLPHQEQRSPPTNDSIPKGIDANTAPHIDQYKTEVFTDYMGRNGPKSQYSTQGKAPIIDEYGIKSNEIRIVLIGKTGQGKSSTGNTIAGADLFHVSRNIVSVTRECKLAIFNRFNRKFVLVDTPDFFDSQMSNEKVTTEIVKSIGMTAPGPHAFLLVLEADRFKNEVLDTVNYLVEGFGKDIFKYLLVVFTRMDDLDFEKTSLDEYVNSVPKELNKILQLCEKRYVGFNNKLKGEKNNGQVQLLLQKIDSMVKANDNQCYTNKLYEVAEKVLRVRQNEIVRELKQTKKKDYPKINKKLANLFEKNMAMNKEHRLSVRHWVKKETEIEDIRDVIRFEVAESQEEAITKQFKKVEVALCPAKTF